MNDLHMYRYVVLPVAKVAGSAFPQLSFNINGVGFMVDRITYRIGWSLNTDETTPVYIYGIEILKEQSPNIALDNYIEWDNAGTPNYLSSRSFSGNDMVADFLSPQVVNGVWSVQMRSFDGSITSNMDGVITMQFGFHGKK